MSQTQPDKPSADKTDWVRIWSYEHDAYWRANSMGYTRHKDEAGLYDRDEAERIVKEANRGLPSDKPNETVEELDGKRYRRLQMKISLPGVLVRAQEYLKKSRDWHIRDHAFMLGELHSHLEQVRENPELLSEFFELWVKE